MFTKYYRSVRLHFFYLFLMGSFTLFSSNSQANPLPNLTVSIEGSNIELEWRTPPGEKVGTFELERSLNGEQFLSLGTQHLIQRKEYGVIYSFTDLKAMDLDLPKFFYRLKHTALSGEISYSEIREVATSSKGKELSVIGYQKAGKQKYTVHFKGNGKVNMTVLNMLGQVKFKQTYTLVKGSKTIYLFTENWKSGSYVIDLKQENKTARYKFTLP